MTGSLRRNLQLQRMPLGDVAEPVQGGTSAVLPAGGPAAPRLLTREPAKIPLE